MAWQVGKGSDVIVGIDPIVGTSTGFYLPEDLRSYLQDLDICTLAQAHNTQSDAKGYWYTAEELNLGGYFINLWTDFTEGLNGAGIRMNDSEDELVWDFKKKQGHLSARNVYDSIVTSSQGMVSSPIDKYLWINSLPNKISCFIWLAVRCKILTWENL